MAEDHPEDLTDLSQPDVEPGALIFLDKEDLRLRFIAACYQLDSYLTDAGIDDLFCDDHFMDLVSDAVLTVCRTLGVVDFSMEAEDVGMAYSDLQELMAHVRDVH